jgi:hypothetical protein
MDGWTVGRTARKGRPSGQDDGMLGNSNGRKILKRSQKYVSTVQGEAVHVREGAPREGRMVLLKASNGTSANKHRTRGA